MIVKKKGTNLCLKRTEATNKYGGLGRARHGIKDRATCDNRFGKGKITRLSLAHKQEKRAKNAQVERVRPETKKYQKVSSYPGLPRFPFCNDKKVSAKSAHPKLVR